MEVVSPHATQLLEAMFAAFRHADSGENEYVMKAIMRLIMYLGPAISPVVPLCLQVRHPVCWGVTVDPTTFTMFSPCWQHSDVPASLHAFRNW